MRAAESIVDNRERAGVLRRRRQVMALQVRGSGLADEGLRDGDRLIVEPRAKVSDGQTVVAEVNGELTVKRVFRDARGRLRLKPANPELLPLAVPASRLRIVGVLVGIFRRRDSRRTRPVQPRIEVAERTLDLTTHVIDQSLRQAETLAAVRTGAAQARLQELAQSLRTLRDCYVDARTPKMRAALLREAGALVRRVRRFDSERPQEAALGLA
jgi:hypothetical protein